MKLLISSVSWHMSSTRIYLFKLWLLYKRCTTVKFYLQFCTLPHWCWFPEEPNSVSIGNALQNVKVVLVISFFSTLDYRRKVIPQGKKWTYVLSKFLAFHGKSLARIQLWPIAQSKASGKKLLVHKLNSLKVELRVLSWVDVQTPLIISCTE